MVDPLMIKLCLYTSAYTNSSSFSTPIPNSSLLDPSKRPSSLAWLGASGKLLVLASHMRLSGLKETRRDADAREENMCHPGRTPTRFSQIEKKHHAFWL